MSIRWAAVRRMLAACAFVPVLCSSVAKAADDTQDERMWETSVGQQQYRQYLQRGEIVPRSSPIYASVDPVANAIAAVAGPQYFAPLRFYVLNEREPNAMAMPGGAVYVTIGMLDFLRTKDQLAGVLCHEVNHDIHHDMYLGYHNAAGGPSAGIEQAAETNADRAGAYTCARAGFNPWGMVWNFRQYRQMTGASHGASADHPSDAHRVADLIALFESDPQTFGRFRDDVADAQPLQHVANAGVAMQQPMNQPYGYGYPQMPQQYQQYPQYPPQYGQYPQMPQQSPQYQQVPPYPPPPLPPCYPGC